MNHAPQFTIGQKVITPDHRAGVVKWVYPAVRAKVRNQYSVAVPDRRVALVLYENELKLQPAGAPDPEVRCLDCGHNNRPLVRTSVLCPVTNQYRKVDKPRLCKHFTPRSTTQGA